ncbi:peptide-N4-(N-acetyl-beta-glucosaminyl) asparagine amidase A [Colletotrichum tofieldiae]|nr:peptide-N4-(N-acetyl-beta-glucosaminyl) asparagine amidase A [Colletotrichum tofieldiae]
MTPRLVTRALAFSLFVLVLNTGYVASRNLMPEAPLSDYATRHQGIKADAPAPLGPQPEAEEAGRQQRPLECFQVAQPVLGPNGPVYQEVARGNGDGKGKPPTGPTECKVQLMDHSFGNSFDKPFVGEYTPPGCDFNRVIVNFTATSAGRQLDRLALWYLGDTEVWRTSTAEPRAAPGIIWTYWKDMTPYLSLWKSPQKIIFDLPNLIGKSMFQLGPERPGYQTAHVPNPNSLHRIYGALQLHSDRNLLQIRCANRQRTPADLIIPISSRNASSNTGSAWQVPEREAVSTIKFPRNANRAVFSVSANGQGTEEFWWSNVLQSDAAAFNATVGMAPAGSPWREVQVLIDDQLAGVQWPFPVIFTGGVVPSFHRPLVGLDAYDLREHEVDISPWLPVLSDGKEHTFKIKVAGIADEGDRRPEWTQNLSYTNNATLGQFGRNGFNSFIITGTDALLNGLVKYQSTYSYPLIVNQTANMTAAGDLSLDATLFQELKLEVEGAGVYPTGLEAYNAPNRNRQGQSGQYQVSKLSTFRNGTAVFNMPADMKNSSAFGTTRQVFRFSGGRDGARDIELYTRRVRASNNTVTSDEEKSADGRERVLSVPSLSGDANGDGQ